MSTLRSLMARLRRLWLVDEGVAAVEFALILPVMLLVYIGSMEASTLIAMDRRVQLVAGAVGDLVARADSTISSSMLTDYFRAASGIMTPYPSGNVRQVVTQVDVSSTGVTSVAWSRQYVNGVYGTGTEHPKNSTYKLPTAMIDISKGQSVIVSKASTSYLPLYGIVINQPVSLFRENFFIPRFGNGLSAP
ncbi:Flp pilus assembly protein TadG [Devosia sp. YR412]|uniref:TadE/TadG family type IV pilus assembly protein n=1 Tax=Devosia sp. YR412 TaxID=1881030 RepID=UPI0008AD5D8D|nr:TadE/TadG family type IV pilus assembly protein [Devosia sp. YR412]SEP69879.1 Flp pilus assembly protein TadG [Devosia sp. YR412]